MNKQDRDEIKEILHDYISGVIAKQEAKEDIISFKLDRIEIQTTKTNGRVTCLEENTRFWTWFTCRPIRLLLIPAILFVFVELFKMPDIIAWIKLLIHSS